MTFQALTDWFTERILPARVQSDKLRRPEIVKARLKRFNECFGNTRVMDIKKVDLEGYQARRKAEGMADSTIDQEIKYAKQVVSEAFYNDLVSGDTLKAFKVVKGLLKKGANKREVKEPEVREKVAKILDHAAQHLRWVIHIFAFTGMRPNEILNLTRDRVDLKAGFIHLRAGDTKNGKPRDIPICDDLRAVFESIPMALHDNHVILYKGKPIKTVRGSLKSACKKAGVAYGRFKEGGFILYDLRKAFRTYLRKSGVHDSVAMEITGHSSQEMLDRYNGVDEQDKKDAVSHLDGYLAEIRQTVRQNKVLEK